MQKTAAIIFISLVLFACKRKSTSQKRDIIKAVDTLLVAKATDTLVIEKPNPGPDTLELRLIARGLIKARSIDSSIRVDLRYSSQNNFLGLDLYGPLQSAYLLPEVAEALGCAQQKLNEMRPGFKLVIFDAVRPLYVQQQMWDTLKLPIAEKTKYLSNPKNGSIHNYGAAVDLSIVDGNDSLLDMGTKYDHFGPLAYPRKEFEMLENGKLSQEQVSNRRLLRNVMVACGFFPITTEWWHFNFCSREEAKERYKLIR